LPAGKHGGILTPLHYGEYRVKIYQISNKSQAKTAKKAPDTFNLPKLHTLLGWNC